MLTITAIAALGLLGVLITYLVYSGRCDRLQARERDRVEAELQQVLARDQAACKELVRAVAGGTPPEQAIAEARRTRPTLPGTSTGPGWDWDEADVERARAEALEERVSRLTRDTMRQGLVVSGSLVTACVVACLVVWGMDQPRKPGEITGPGTGTGTPTGTGTVTGKPHPDDADGCDEPGDDGDGDDASQDKGDEP
jgi:hypothetical protein